MSIYHDATNGEIPRAVRNIIGYGIASIICIYTVLNSTVSSSSISVNDNFDSKRPSLLSTEAINKLVKDTIGRTLNGVRQESNRVSAFYVRGDSRHSNTRHTYDNDSYNYGAQYSQELEAEAFNIIKGFEGNASHLYLDMGNITTGIGYNLEATKNTKKTFMDINWLTIQGKIATKQEKEIEWLNISSIKKDYSKKNYKASSFKDKTILRLPKGFAEKQAKKHIKECIKQLRSKYKSNFDIAPIEIKLVLVDIVYSMGFSKFDTEYKKLSKAMNDRNWAKVAKEVYRGTPDQKRNTWALKTARDGALRATTGASFIFPLENSYNISSKYGYRKHPITGKKNSFHHGLDVEAPSGTPVYAAESGTIRKITEEKRGGNVIVIVHNNGYETKYLHLSKFSQGLKVDDKVYKGQEIAKTGDSGESTGAHLDFRIFKNGNSINPLQIYAKINNKRTAPKLARNKAPKVIKPTKPYM